MENSYYAKLKREELDLRKRAIIEEVRDSLYESYDETATDETATLANEKLDLITAYNSILADSSYVTF